MAGADIPELYLGQWWQRTSISYTFLTSWPSYMTDGLKQVYAVGGDVTAPGPLTPSQILIVNSILQYIQTITNITFNEIDQDGSTNQVGVITFALWTPHGVLASDDGRNIDTP